MGKSPPKTVAPSILPRARTNFISWDNVPWVTLSLLVTPLSNATTSVWEFRIRICARNDSLVGSRHIQFASLSQTGDASILHWIFFKPISRQSSSSPLLECHAEFGSNYAKERFCIWPSRPRSISAGCSANYVLSTAWNMSRAKVDRPCSVRSWNCVWSINSTWPSRRFCLVDRRRRP